jgi:hypothetical protein
MTAEPVTTEQPISDPMRYIDTPPELVYKHKQIEEAVSRAYAVLLTVCPRSAERTLAVRKLQEARMWANAAVVFDGRTYQT